MKEKLVTISLAILLQACQSTNTDTNATITDPNAKENSTSLNTGLKDKFIGMQWALFKPNGRYAKSPFNVSDDANIHMGQYYKKYTGKGIKIAVIDDSLDINQEDLQGAIIKTYNIETNTTDVSPSTKKSHGTAVVGIIAARKNTKGIFGVASDSEIIFIKHAKSISEDDMVRLFQKAQEFDADIINCSWGSGKDDKTGKLGVSDKAREKIISLAKTGRGGKGTIIVFASGNSNKDIKDLNLEANIEEVISVGATNGQNKRAKNSNYGKNLDLVAPGGGAEFLGIATLSPMGSNEGNSVLIKGTSAAAPIVSGAIALMLEKNPDLTREKIQELLHNTSDKIGEESYVNGHNKYYGYGKLNVKSLLDNTPNN